VIDARKIEVVEDEIAAALRLMGPERRLAMMFQAETFARTLMRADAKDLSDVWMAFSRGANRIRLRRPQSPRLLNLRTDAGVKTPEPAG
jgi:hypothetical protein